MGNVLTTSTSICCRSSCATVHLVTEHCTSSTSMDRDITTTAVSEWMQDVSAYEMIQPVIDDTLEVITSINNLRGPLQQHLLLQVRQHHTWPEVRQTINSFFANSYMHPGQNICNIDQDINLIKNKKGKGKTGKGTGKKGKGKGYNN